MTEIICSWKIIKNSLVPGISHAGDVIISWHLGGHREHPALVYRSWALLSFLGFLVLHVAAHLVNALNFSENYSEEFVTLNAANYRGEVSQLSFNILILSISFKYMNICILNAIVWSIQCTCFMHWKLTMVWIPVDFISFSGESMC